MTGAESTNVAKCAPIAMLTLFIILTCLWIRRGTLRAAWERSATLNILFQGLGLLLFLPFASPAFDYFFRWLTGMVNVEHLLGDLCYIAAFSCMVHSTYKRLTDGRHIVQLVAPALVISIPAIIVTFTISNASRIYRPDNLDIPCDFWLKVYWVLVCGTLAYLILLQIHALTILREYAGQEYIANGYLFSCLSVLLACITQTVAALWPGLHNIGQGRLVWFFVCVGAMGFAITAARSWVAKINWFTPRHKRFVWIWLILGTVPGAAKPRNQRKQDCENRDPDCENRDHGYAP